MKKHEVKVGHVYIARVSDRLVPVRIDSVHSRQGWNATNVKTGRRVHIKSAQRLRYPAKRSSRSYADEARAKAKGSTAPTAKAGAEDAKAKATDTRVAKPKRMSALDAAATALRTLGKPANCKTLITIMAEQGLWTSPNGKTPEATLYAAILREIKAKGDAARFRKVARGQFECAG